MANHELAADELQIVLEGRHSAANVVVGGNSSVTRVEAFGEAFAVKAYGGHSDPLARLRREHFSVAAVSRSGFPGFAQVRGVSEPDLLAVFSWIEGSHPSIDAAFVSAALAVLRRLHELSGACPFETFPEAVDAVFERSQLLSQLASRTKTLLESDIPEVSIFAKQQLTPALRNVPMLRRADDGGSITLSPSDFGPHNLLRPAGSEELVCIDLEFFGWDDATKLVCDALLHPMARWSIELAEAFLEGAAQTYGISPERILLHGRAFALKWSAIVARRAEGMLRDENAEGFRALRLAGAYLNFGVAPLGRAGPNVGDLTAIAPKEDGV